MIVNKKIISVFVVFMLYFTTYGQQYAITKYRQKHTIIQLGIVGFYNEFSVINPNMENIREKKIYKMTKTWLRPDQKFCETTIYDALGRVLSIVPSDIRDGKEYFYGEKYFSYKKNTTHIIRKDVGLSRDSLLCVKKKDTITVFICPTQAPYIHAELIFITNKRNHLNKVIYNSEASDGVVNDTINDIISYNKNGYTININRWDDYYAEVNDTVNHIVTAKLHRCGCGIGRDKKYYYYADSFQIKQTEVDVGVDSLITTDYLNKAGKPDTRLIEQYGGKFLFFLKAFKYYYAVDKKSYLHNYNKPVKKKDACNNVMEEFKYNAKDLLIYHRSGSIEYFYEYEYFD